MEKKIKLTLTNMCKDVLDDDCGECAAEIISLLPCSRSYDFATKVLRIETDIPEKMINELHDMCISRFEMKWADTVKREQCLSGEHCKECLNMLFEDEFPCSVSIVEVSE